MNWHVFISHASDDRETVARPLAEKLRSQGLRVWLDENVLTVGDSLRAKIDQGLAQSRFGVVILSPAFFAKDWPQRELNAFAARERDNRKVILPVWHGIDRGLVERYSPILADKMASDTGRGLDTVVAELMAAIGFDSAPELLELGERDKEVSGGPGSGRVAEGSSTSTVPHAPTRSLFEKIGRAPRLEHGRIYENAMIIPLQTAAPACLAFAQNGKSLACPETGPAGSEIGVVLVDTKTGETKHAYRDYAGAPTAIAYEVLRFIYGTESGYILMWDTHDGKRERLIECQQRRVTCIAERDAFISVGLEGNIAAVVEVYFGHFLIEAAGTREGCIASAISRNGELLASQICRPISPGNVRCEIQVARFRPDKETIMDVAYQTPVTVSDWGPAEGFDPEVYKCSQTIAVSPEGTHVAVVIHRYEVALVRLNDGAVTTFALPHGEKARSIALGPDVSGFAVGTWAGNILLCRTWDGQIIQTLPGHGGGVHSMAYSKDGATMASAATDGTLRLWRKG